MQFNVFTEIRNDFEISGHVKAKDRQKLKI